MSQTFEPIASKFVTALTYTMGRAHGNSVAHGFWDWCLRHRDDPEAQVLFKLSRHALIQSEVSEATEAVRKSLPSDHLPGYSMEAEEMADVVIRVMDYCVAFGIPLAEVILAKMDFNAGRPFMHGDKKA